jgi:signal transduction histidine kinase
MKMELRRIVNAITKTLVVVAFWAMFLVSLLLEPEISFMQIAMALIKAVVISGVFWVLFVMLVDTLLKTILLDAKEQNVDRIDGGLSYHVTEPSSEEIAWMKSQEREKEREKQRDMEEMERERELALELAQKAKAKK